MNSFFKNNHHKIAGNKLLSSIFLILITFLMGIPQIISVSAAGNEPPEPTPGVNSPSSLNWINNGRLSKPILPPNPTMADKGAIPYWGICLSCHGDKGQGLTDEWRAAGFGEDMNCWKSKCHAPNHPTPGFVFPRIVPAIVGPNTLQRFTTALELKNYIKTSMPRWDPGSLSDEDSWNITAYLLRENKVLAPGVDFKLSEAMLIPVHYPVRQPDTDNFGKIILGAILGMATILMIINKIHPFKNSSKWVAEKIRPNFFQHLHPPTLPFIQSRWRYTLGAGGLSIFLLLVIVLTGIVETFYYIPTPAEAGPSIQIITFLIPYGEFIRAIHYWAAQILIAVMVVHLIRVVFTGSFHPPRRFNYLLGLGLFVVILLTNFTGFVLRWDTGIHWALIVGTNLLKTIPLIGEKIYFFVVGSDFPGPATLTRFYAWHIFGLIIAAAVLLIWHLFRVRRDGGIEAPPPQLRMDNRRITRFELVNREIFAMLVASLVLLVIASLFPPPLAAPIQDASAPLNLDVRAPWFFLWVQYLLRFGPAFWMGIMIPIILLIIIATLPYLSKASLPAERGKWFPSSGRLIRFILAILMIAWLAFTVLETLN